MTWTILILFLCLANTGFADIDSGLRVNESGSEKKVAGHTDLSKSNIRMTNASGQTIAVMIATNAKDALKTTVGTTPLKEFICGNGKFDVGREDCDGSIGCLADCTCGAGTTADVSGTCVGGGVVVDPTYICQGTQILNAVPCGNNPEPLNNVTSWDLVPNCLTPGACQETCEPGFTFTGGVCVADCTPVDGMCTAWWLCNSNPCGTNRTQDCITWTEPQCGGHPADKTRPCTGSGCPTGQNCQSGMCVGGDDDGGGSGGDDGGHDGGHDSNPGVCTCADPGSCNASGCYCDQANNCAWTCPGGQCKNLYTCKASGTCTYRYNADRNSCDDITGSVTVTLTTQWGPGTVDSHGTTCPGDGCCPASGGPITATQTVSCDGNLSNCTLFLRDDWTLADAPLAGSSCDGYNADSYDNVRYQCVCSQVVIGIAHAVFDVHSACAHAPGWMPSYECNVAVSHEEPEIRKCIEPGDEFRISFDPTDPPAGHNNSSKSESCR